jgi:hypothetical protein
MVALVRVGWRKRLKLAPFVPIEQPPPSPPHTPHTHHRLLLQPRRCCIPVKLARPISSPYDSPSCMCSLSFAQVELFPCAGHGQHPWVRTHSLAYSLQSTLQVVGWWGGGVYGHEERMGVGVGVGVGVWVGVGVGVHVTISSPLVACLCLCFPLLTPVQQLDPPPLLPLRCSCPRACRRELRAYYNGEVHNSLDTWSPTINLNRDPRVR